MPADATDILAAISAQLAPSGLILRGAFNFELGEPAPEALSGNPAKSVVLIGNGGAEYWPIFEAWRRDQAADLAHPLDRWCRHVIGNVAEQIGARAVSPSDRPFLPFQSWAMRAEGLRPSPLGILMHPRYGLWHAYRGALLLDIEVPIQAAEEQNHPCALCAEKPCTNACPVSAHGGAMFAYQACLGFVRSEAGGLCRSGGCLDRNACPVGARFRYPAEVQAFHMSAFAR